MAYHYEVQTWLVVNNHTNEYLGSVDAAGSSAALRKAYKQYSNVNKYYIGIEMVSDVTAEQAIKEYLER